MSNCSRVRADILDVIFAWALGVVAIIAAVLASC